MSCQIIKSRHVLSLQTPEEHQDSYRLFFSFSSASNVSPRQFHGRLDGIVSHSSYEPKDNPQLPKSIWEQAFFAERGEFRNRTMTNSFTGLTWVKTWKNIAKAPIAATIENGTLIVPIKLIMSIEPGERKSITKEHGWMRDTDENCESWYHLNLHERIDFDPTRSHWQDVMTTLHTWSDLRAALDLVRTPPEPGNPTAYLLIEENHLDHLKTARQKAHALTA